MISPLRRRRLRPEELAADADSAGRRCRAASRPPGKAGRAARPDLPRCELPSGEPPPRSAWRRPRRATWWQPSTRWMPRPRGTICFPASTRRPARACTDSRISAAMSGWFAPTSRRRATCARPSSMPACFRDGILRRRTRLRAWSGSCRLAARQRHGDRSDHQAAVLVAPFGRLPAAWRRAVRLGRSAPWRRNPCAATTAR